MSAPTTIASKPTGVTSTSSGSVVPRRVPQALSPRAAFVLQVSMLVSLLTASSAPTPLYSVYRAEWGFSPITITIVFGIYAIAVLAALLVVGRLSDFIGRRPVLLAAIALQLVALVVFIVASGVTDLVVARVIQGLSTGAAVAALGAALIDIDRVKGTIANGVSPVTGTATGALLAGFLVQFLPSPTHLVYLVLLAIFVVQLVGVLLMPETSETTPGALASLRPELSMPAGVRGPMLAAFPALVAVWSLAGLYASLGPTLVHILSGSSSYVLGALSLTVLAATGALTTYLARDVEPRRVMVAGMLTLLVGVGLTVLAVQVTSTAGFFIGTAVAGAGFGGGFQGALRTVVPLAAPHQRAGVLSSLYVVSYLALGAPAVGGGFLVDHVGVLTTARDYAAVVMVLAAGALVATLAHARRSTVRARRDVRHSFAGCGQPCAD